jgi:hypothetical protein
MIYLIQIQIGSIMIFFYFSPLQATPLITGWGRKRCTPCTDLKTSKAGSDLNGLITPLDDVEGSHLGAM